MASQIAVIPQKAIHQDGQWLQLLTVSSGSLIRKQEQADMLAQMLIVVKKPATTAEICTQVTLVLFPYWKDEVDDDLQDAVSLLWVNELRGYPCWAIERAVQFWIGRKNPEKIRRSKPLPGDISEQAESQMWHVRSVECHIRWWEKYRGDYPAFLDDKRVDRPN